METSKAESLVLAHRPARRNRWCWRIGAGSIGGGIGDGIGGGIGGGRSVSDTTCAAVKGVEKIRRRRAGAL